ncbi:hypothetical protein HAX54_037927 [Datura stramonium]|uniref:Uncharacterized protein n=1 Tax=Datura stramonium TaxID=4076 RepID=A0ABS8SHL3_DATST|nr:hypothetical protein [Datura stramonium]
MEKIQGGIQGLLEIRIQIKHVFLVKGSHVEGRLVLNIKLLCKVSILKQVWQLLQLTNGGEDTRYKHSGDYIDRYRSKYFQCSGSDEVLIGKLELYFTGDCTEEGDRRDL